MSFHTKGVEHILAQFGPSAAMAAALANTTLAVQPTTTVPTFRATDAGVYLHYGELKFGAYRTLRSARLAHLGNMTAAFSADPLTQMHRRLEQEQTEVLSLLEARYPEVCSERDWSDEMRILRREEAAAIGMPYGIPVLVSGLLVGGFLITIYTGEHVAARLNAAAAIQDLGLTGMHTITWRAADALVDALGSRVFLCANDLIKVHRQQQNAVNEVREAFATVAPTPAKRGRPAKKAVKA